VGCRRTYILPYFLLSVMRVVEVEVEVEGEAGFSRWHETVCRIVTFCIKTPAGGPAGNFCLVEQIEIFPVKFRREDLETGQATKTVGPGAVDFQGAV
jgi:hypothetical protein